MINPGGIIKPYSIDVTEGRLKMSGPAIVKCLGTASASLQRSNVGFNSRDVSQQTCRLIS